MPPTKPSTDAIAKLPEELKAAYKASPKSSPIVEGLKVATALKLWYDRGYRDIQFEVPLTFGEKTVYAKVMTKNADVLVIAVECASTVRHEQLHKRVALLQSCLPPDSHIIAVFPEALEKQAEKVTQFTDEVWVTGKNGTVNQMMFRTAVYKR
jgi:hypothetical protein